MISPVIHATFPSDNNSSHCTICKHRVIISQAIGLNEAQFRGETRRVSEEGKLKCVGKIYSNDKKFQFITKLRNSSLLDGKVSK